MSFHPDGTLYGMAARGSQLFTVDTATGVATRIGAACDSPQIGAPGGFCRRGNAIAFDPLGTLFWANDVEIAELDPSTGLIVGVAIPLDFTPFGTPTDPDAGFRVVGMVFHPLTGELYASVLQRQFQDSPPARATLAILDPWTGTFDIIGQVDGTGVKLEGIAFTPAPDHFRCYAVDDDSVRDMFPVSLEDQFRSDPAVEVKRAVSICAPVDKDGEGIVDPDTHLVCYMIGRSGALHIDATVSNQFGNDQELTVLNERTLCVPSSKEIID
jgi:hypothetical protein